MTDSPTPGTAACNYRFVADPEPCGTCPYLLNAPSGLWDATEYAKLVEYDSEFIEQPVAMFMCHSAAKLAPGSDTLCRGWLEVHGFDLLAVRLAAASGKLDPETVNERTRAKCHESGTAAAEHGMRDIAEPGPKARRAIDKLANRRNRT